MSSPCGFQFRRVPVPVGAVPVGAVQGCRQAGIAFALPLGGVYGLIRMTMAQRRSGDRCRRHGERAARMRVVPTITPRIPGPALVLAFQFRFQEPGNQNWNRNRNLEPTAIRSSLSRLPRCSAGCRRFGCPSLLSPPDRQSKRCRPDDRFRQPGGVESDARS
jgi:hypothetical protein